MIYLRQVDKINGWRTFWAMRSSLEDQEKMARYRDISPVEMTSAQLRVYDLIVAGKRGHFGGRSICYSTHPRFASTQQSLASICDGAPSSPDRLSELAITLAQFWRA
jgi:hypothetical protein